MDSNFNEEKFAKSVSLVLRMGIYLFILFSLVSFLLEIFESAYSQMVLKYGILILVLTPLFRIIMLFIGFLRLKENQYTIFSLILILIILLEVMI
ncbi:MAG: DUF1634 domain-containing protein [Leptonema sp. (in: bacteria)]